MRLKKRWGLLAAMTLLAGTVQGSPVGQGVLGLRTSMQFVGASQHGLRAGVDPYSVEEAYAQDVKADLALPVYEWLALLGAYENTWAGVKAEENMAVNEVFKYTMERAASAFEGGIRVFPWAFFGRGFGSAADGNPDGRLYWPVVSGLWTQRVAEQHFVVFKQTAGYSPYPTDRSKATIWAWDLRLLLPLHRRLSAFCSYSLPINARNEYESIYSNRFGYTSVPWGSWSESSTFGLSLWVPVFTPAQSAVAAAETPGIGSIGELKVDAEYRRGPYDLYGTSDADFFTLRLTAPMREGYALSLGYKVAVAQIKYFGPSVATEPNNLVNHRIELGVTVDLTPLSRWGREAAEAHSGMTQE